MEIKTYAPVIIPTLNRYDHFWQCLESLEKSVGADKTDIYVGLDYPPAEKYVEGWKKIDAYLAEKEKQNGFKSLKVFRHDHNLGVLLSTSNEAFLTRYISKHYDRWIFSEDDNVFSPNFLVYMNSCLEKYKDDDNVVAISGYSYPIDWKVSDNATCLKQNVCASMWGTGFWKNKFYQLIDYLEQNKLKRSLCKSVNENSYNKMIDAAKRDYFSMACTFRGYKDSKIDTWRTPCDFVCRCYLALENKYCVSPVVSKVRNFGFDGSGACCQTINNEDGDTAGTYNYTKQPIDESSIFELVEDTLRDDATNRDRLNAFDYRSPQEMKRANKLLWLCEHTGIWSAKIFGLLLLFTDGVELFINKIKK